MIHLKLTHFQIFFVILLSNNCLDSAAGNKTWFNSMAFLFTGGGKELVPYSPEDYGIPSPPKDSPLAFLPAISEREREAIGEMLRDMDANGQLDTKFTYEATHAAKDVLFNRPLTHEELLEKVEKEIQGASYTSPTYGSESEILQKESQAADEFYKHIAADLPSMTIDQLIKVRENFTLSLVMIRFTIDYGDPNEGIPMSFLVMAREKAVAIRQKVNEELIRRGVTHL